VNQVVRFEVLGPSEIAETSREGCKAGQPGSAKAASRVHESSFVSYNPTSFLSSPTSMPGVLFDALDWPLDTPNRTHQHPENNTVGAEVSGFTFAARILITLLVPLQVDYFFPTRNQHNICHSNKQTVLDNRVLTETGETLRQVNFLWPTRMRLHRWTCHGNSSTGNFH
jgi:hypothetical protein